MFPVAYWLNDGTLPGLVQRIAGGPLVRDGWITRGAVGRLVDEHRRRRIDHHVRIWMLLNLDAWFRIYINGKSNADMVGAPEAVEAIS